MFRSGPERHLMTKKIEETDGLVLSFGILRLLVRYKLEGGKNSWQNSIRGMRPAAICTRIPDSAVDFQRASHRDSKKQIQLDPEKNNNVGKTVRRNTLNL